MNTTANHLPSTPVPVRKHHYITYCGCGVVLRPEIKELGKIVYEVVGNDDRATRFPSRELAVVAIAEYNLQPHHARIIEEGSEEDLQRKRDEQKPASRV